MVVPSSDYRDVHLAEGGREGSSGLSVLGDLEDELALGHEDLLLRVGEHDVALVVGWTHDLRHLQRHKIILFAPDSAYLSKVNRKRLGTLEKSKQRPNND